MDDNVGVIVDYKCLIGPKTGKIYRRRFEKVTDFAVWATEHNASGLVQILNAKMVTLEMLYWNNRWIAAKAK